MLQHLDDPVPLPPSTPEQRRATLHRGIALRRRRRAEAFAVAAVAVVAIVGGFVLSPGLRGGTVDPPVAVSSSPSAAATATVGPGRGTATFWDSSPEVSATFTMPAGWATEGGAISKLDAAGLPFGLALFDVANVYTDGCRWRMVNPKPGPTVDDLVSAFAKVPGIEGTARDVVVDGFHGKLVNYTVPDYKKDKCIEGMFAIIKSDSNDDNSPNLWAGIPNEKHQIRILDVGGTR